MGVDLCGVTLVPVPLIDVETANWMTSTYPGSPFARGPVISATASNGRRTPLRSDAEHEFVLGLSAMSRQSGRELLRLSDTR